MNRRRFAKTIASAAALAFTGGRLLAAPGPQSRFLLVFLRGGYDAANLLVPVSSDFYYQSRPEIAIPRPGPDANAALPLDTDWGLHPALRDTIYPLYRRGGAAFIPFAGTHDTSRSHFETQDDIELGQPQGGRRDYRSGFLNRLAGVVSGADPIAFTDQLPVAFHGAMAVPNTSLKSVGKPGVDARQSQLIASMYQGTTLAAPVAEGFAVRDQVMRDMAGEMEAASRNAMTTKGFELESLRIARLMKERYTIGFVDIGGWDTHVGQGGATGYLAGRFEELGRGLAAYAQEMGSAWRDTTVVVVSEFGRTFRQNGNRGTDHGHGTVFWVLGGSVRGGRVAGDQVRVEAASLFQNRDFPVRNEYRALLGGLFARQFGLNNSQMAQVFAGVPPSDIGLL